MHIILNALPLLWPPCGTRTYTEELLCNLAELDPSLRVDLLTDRVLPNVTLLKGHTQRIIAPKITNLKTKLVWEALALPRAARRLSESVIHVPYHMASTCGQRSVMTVHDAMIWECGKTRLTFGENIYKRMLSHAARRAPVIITVSEFSKSRIVSQLGVDENRIHVCPLGVRSFLRDRPSDAQICKVGELHSLTKPFVLYIGGTGAHKGVLELAQAYWMLPEDVRYRFDLVVVGSLNSENEYHAKVRVELAKEGAQGRIVNIDRLEDSELAAVYSSASLFVFPSFHEGFGLPPLEAMACGAPVAASNRASIPEVLGDAALYFDPADLKQMVSVITSILTSPSTAAKLVLMGTKRASQFNWRATAEATLRVYRQLG